MDAFKLNHIVLKTEAHKLAERANRLGNQKISVHTDMTKYESRLRTYKEWPLSFISAKQMSKAGFYYYGKQDNVKCEFCSIELGYWQRGEDPTDEHKKKSPHCAYFKENEGKYYYTMFELWKIIRWHLVTIYKLAFHSIKLIK